MEFSVPAHIPVLKDEIVEWLEAKHGGDFIDCTLGGGGHTRALLDANPTNTVVALDRDPEAVRRAEAQLSFFGARLEIHHQNFGSIQHVTNGKRFKGMLVDLGTSMDQLKGGRGFSFRDTGALDMRMNSEDDRTAHTVVNEYSEPELFVALKRGGVGSEAKAVARAIVQARPIDNTQTLSGVIERAARGKSTKTEIHPATVCFQAIRIEVNREIEEIDLMLEAAPSVVHMGGRLAVISFHSIEDRLVTHRMRAWEQGDTTPAKYLVAAPDRKGKLLTKKAVVPGEAEVQRNPASRSARLRVFEFKGQ